MSQTNFATQIDTILQQLHGVAAKISIVQNNADELLNCLATLDSKQSNMLAELGDRAFKTKLQNIDFQIFIDKLKKAQTQLNKLQSRFGRKTLNIAVVGIAGQGKSRLLQTLTGLSADVIPDGKDGDCTAVRSNIYHRSELDNEINITVKYHNESSFLQEVILPYYQELEITPLPRSLAEFSSLQLDDNLDFNQVKRDKYEHFKTYYNKLDSYRHLLQESSKKSQKNIDPNQLKSYITQDNREDRDYLAIKEVDIYCNFPKSDIGNIAFVDMPGLGDSKINNYQSLLQTLGEDIDFVLFMRMPGTIYRQTNDLDSTFYDLANSAIPNLPIKEWSFYVVNYYPQLGNKLGCDKFQTKVKQKNIVADAVIADCANTKEVNQNVLAPVLDYLTEHLNSLDIQYTDKCQSQLVELQTEISKQLERVSVHTQEAISFGDLTTRYTNLFNELYESLHTKLSNEAKAINNAKNSNNAQLAEFIQQAINDSNAEDKVPTVERLAEAVQKLSYAEVFPQQLRILHANINKPFNKVDDCLKDSLSEAKGKIVDILIECGKLDKIISNTQLEQNDFFDNLLQAIPEHLEVDKLKSALITIKNATLSYEAEIKKILDKHKHHLDPDKTKYQLGNKTKNRFQLIRKEEKITPQYLRQTLIRAYTAAIAESKPELMKLAADPNRKLANMIKTFVEEAFLDDENGKVKDDWRKFLSYYIAEIWSDEFGADAKDITLKKQWMQSIEDAQNVNSLGFAE